MPITQDRFLSVIEAAKAISDSLFRLDDIFRQVDGAGITARANSVAEQSPDTIARQAMADMVGLVTIMRSIITDHAQMNAKLIGRIEAEQLHFNKNKRSNTKAAFYQRQARNRNKETPTYHSPFSFNEQETQNQQNQQEREEQIKANKLWYSGPNAPTPPPNYDPISGTFSTITEPLGESSSETPPTSTKIYSNTDPQNPIPEQSEIRIIPERSESGSNLSPNPNPNPTISTPSSPKTSPPPQNTSSEPLGESRSEPKLEPRKGKDGITRHLPSDEELNQPPSSNLL